MFRMVLMLIGLGINPARAQFVVSDPENLAQNALNHLELAAQTANQVRQLKQDLKFMQQQTQSLVDLGWKDSYALQRHLDFFNSLRWRVKGLNNDYKRLDHDFRHLYKIKNKPIDQKLSDWNHQTEKSIQRAMKSHGGVEDSAQRMETVSSLIEKQRLAQGDLAALQTLGELMAIQARQIEELKTIIMLDSRAKQSRMMEGKSLDKARSEHEKHLMKDFNKPQKARRPLKRFPSLGKGAY